MNTFLLNLEEMFTLKKLVGVSDLGTVTLKQFLSTTDCDKYDCFFRGVQCPCEGICDGKA